MLTDRREQIRRSLARLAQSQQATMTILEQTLSLLCEELSLDPLAHFQAQSSSPSGDPRLAVDPSLLTVHFQGKTCFLGNTLPFRFLARLAQRPNRYFSYEELLATVWDGSCRSDSSVRSVVKVLRRRLREAGMGELADAIDGTVPGRYAIKLQV
jgi:DNA-binding response OmpR family regulator